MLGYIREQVQGWIAWAIIILLIIPFALWGINQYFHGGSDINVATVNGEAISQKSYQHELQMQRERLRQMLGAQFNPNLMDAQLKQRTLDDMVNHELLSQAAQSNGYRVSSDLVIKTIETIDGFQEDGKFSNARYKQLLQLQGETPATFESRMHRAILTQQSYSGLAATEFATPRAVDSLLKLQEQTRDIGYLILKADNYKKSEDASDEVVKQLYEKNKDRYMTPEMVSLQYLELDAKKLADTTTKPTDEELKQFYDERSSMYMVPEERKSSHILLKVDPDANKEQIEAVKKKAEDIRKQLINGADFAELAKKYSDDPGSSKLGGDIGFMGKGSLDPAYEKAMYALKVGEISEPVLSSFGYHIIKLTEIHEAKVKTFEQVKSSLISDYQQNQADKKYFDLADKLTNRAYEVNDTLQDAADATGLKIQTTDMFAKSGGKGIAANPKVLNSAFSEDVLGRGYNSEPIELGENHVVVIRVKDHQQAKPKTLDEVKDQIKNQIIAEKARQRAEQTGANIIEQLTKGEATPSAAAKIANTEWKQAGNVKRSDHSIDVKIIKQAFQLSRPAQDKSVFGGVQLASGDYAVMGVSKVTDGDPAKIDEAKRKTLERNLISMDGEAAYDNYLQSLKSSATIVLDKNNL